MVRLSSCIAILALSVCILADELVIVDIKSSSTSTDKFSSVKDEHTLDKAVASEVSTFRVLANTVHRFDALVRPHLGKIALRQAIEILNETKPKVEELQKDLIVLKGITITLKHSIDFGYFIDKISLAKSDTDDLLVHLTDILSEFECKFKRKCFDDDLKAAQNSLLQKITIMVDIEEDCTVFTHECSERYKELQGKFEDFQKEKISALYTSFDTVCEGSCFPTPKQREQSSKDLLEFDTRVKGWILTMKAKLKKLVENELNHLNDHFLADCTDLNNLKISAKNKESDIPFLNGMVTSLGTSLTTTNKLHDEFVDVFDLLVFLEDILTDDIFTDCFKRASTMYYLINGFKIQINDCIAATKKQILVAQAKANFTMASDQLIKVNEIFTKESTALGIMKEKVETCRESTRLEDNLSDFKSGLAQSRTDLEFLQKRFHEADVKECAEIQALNVNSLLMQLGDLEKENNENLCFLQIFDEIFCHH